MSKSELDDVLRWGTEELFKDEEATMQQMQDSQGGGKSTEQNIVWDDGAVDKLLERDVEEEPVAAAEAKPEQTSLANEYLSSFKVGSWQMRG